MKRNVYLKSTDLKDINPIIEMLVLKHALKEEIVNVVDSLSRITSICDRYS